jgi:hypothetical protein
MAFGILHVYNVSWLWHGYSETATVPASCWFNYTDVLWCTASKTLSPYDSLSVDLRIILSRN